MVDGEVYRAAADGSVEKVPDDETISFSNVTFFDKDEEVKIEKNEDTEVEDSSASDAAKPR